MKITRSFTLDLEIVKDLKKEKNQSKTIEKALRAYWVKEVDLETILSDQMLYELMVRAETEFDKKMLMRMWRRSREISRSSLTDEHTISDQESNSTQ